ncbi:unnamed protein product [Chrysoparadoxa australica]
MIGNSRLHWAVMCEEEVKHVWHTAHLSSETPGTGLPRSLFDETSLKLLERSTALDAGQSPGLIGLAGLEAAGRIHLKADHFYVACVVGSQRQKLANICDGGFFPVDNSGLLITNHARFPTIGIDRVLAVAGAAHDHHWPVMVIDCGSALTCTAGDAQRGIEGGNIVPGVALQKKALADYTAALREHISKGPDLPQERPELWQCKSQDAINAGILNTLLAGIVMNISSFQQSSVDSKAPVVFTGGDGEWMHGHAKQDKLLEGIADYLHHDPHVIHKGIGVFRNLQRIASKAVSESLKATPSSRPRPRGKSWAVMVEQEAQRAGQEREEQDKQRARLEDEQKMDEGRTAEDELEDRQQMDEAKTGEGESEDEQQMDEGKAGEGESEDEQQMDDEKAGEGEQEDVAEPEHETGFDADEEEESGGTDVDAPEAAEEEEAAAALSTPTRGRALLRAPASGRENSPINVDLDDSEDMEMDGKHEEMNGATSPAESPVASPVGGKKRQRDKSPKKEEALERVQRRVKWPKEGPGVRYPVGQRVAFYDDDGYRHPGVIVKEVHSRLFEVKLKCGSKVRVKWKNLQLCLQDELDGTNYGEVALHFEGEGSPPDAASIRRSSSDEEYKEEDASEGQESESGSSGESA